jgi:hypothetical protein
MHDDALVNAWMADADSSVEPVRRAVDAALARDESEGDRSEWIRNASLGTAAVLWVALIWCAAHGITPLVRGGYALMAVGIAVILFAEFAVLSWRFQARPGPSDSLTQIQTSITMLARQATLSRTALVWCAPIFIGGLMIAWWVYAERSHTSATVIAAAVVAGCAATLWGGSRMAREYDVRRAQLERVLRDLEA